MQAQIMGLGMTMGLETAARRHAITGITLIGIMFTERLRAFRLQMETQRAAWGVRVPSVLVLVITFGTRPMRLALTRTGALPRLLRANLMTELRAQMATVTPLMRKAAQQGSSMEPQAFIFVT